MSNLTALEYVQNNSALTTGLLNQRFSVISANLVALNSDVTLNLPSGTTFSLYTNLDASGRIHATTAIGIGATPSTISTEVLTITANSGVADYIHFSDASASKSDYLLGSRAGGTADGLNLYDLSGSTMIVSFSKQSVRFFQQVIGPVFDVGGDLTATYNAATFGTGSQSTESRIQAAINQASIDGIARVYLPKSMYPYSASSISFIYSVQMVREGGNWLVYDAQAYGARGNGVASDLSALLGAAQSIPAAGGTLYIPPGTYQIPSPLTIGPRTTVFGEPGTAIRQTSITEDGIHLTGADSIVDGMTVIGASTSTTNTYYGIAITAANALITNSVLSGWNISIGNGGDSAAAPGTRIIGNLIKNTVGTGSGQGYGVLSNSSRAIIVANQFENITRHGIYFTGNVATGGARSSVAVNNVIRSSPGVATQDLIVCFAQGTQSYVSDILIANNYIEHQTPPTNTIPSIGIYDRVVNVCVSGNVLTGGQYAGVRVSPSGGSSAGYPRQVFIGNNVIASTSTYAILIEASSVSCVIGMNQLSSGSILDLGTDTRFYYSSDTIFGESGNTTSVKSSLSVGNNLSATRYQLQTVAFASRDATYHYINRQDGVTGIYLGGAGDQSSYYDNNTHYFRLANGTHNIQMSSGQITPVTAGGSDCGTVAQPFGFASFRSGISVGGSGSFIPAISSTSSLVAPFVVQGSASSFTIIVWAAANPGDHILVTPGTTTTVSSISSGLVAHSHCTKAGQIEFRLSNVSTLVQNQSTRTWYFTRIAPF